MGTILKEKVLTAKKIHNCNACICLRESNTDLFNQLTYKEKKAVVRMKKQKWKIIPGQKYLYMANTFDGDFVIFKADLEINEICLKYNLYQEN
jgi:hypothetical protein